MGVKNAAIAIGFIVYGFSIWTRSWPAPSIHLSVYAQFGPCVEDLGENQNKREQLQQTVAHN